METRITIDLPMPAAEIKKRIDAWTLLFGAAPRIEVSGTFRCADGEIAFPSSNTVLAVGRKYLTARLDGRPELLDPMTTEFQTSSKFLRLIEER